MCCAATVARGDDASRIKPYAQNRFYWQYEGKPVLLLGGSKNDNLFQSADLAAHLDDMASVGANYIRNTMSDRDSGDLKAFKELAGGEYDLNQWNDEYWTRFQNLLQWTYDRDIIVQIEVWDRFDYSRDPWLTSPYNPQNNVNYTTAESGLATTYPDHPGQNKQPFFKTVPALENNTVVLGFQQKFVDKMLSYSLQHDHVLYCMDNETSGSPEWGKYWSGYIKTEAAAAGKTVETTEMWDSWDVTTAVHKNTLDHPELYSFSDISQNTHISDQTHWDRIQWTREYLSARPWPINIVKIYGADGGSYGNTNDAIERFWRQVTGGCASSRFHRPTSGLGLASEAKAAIGAARKLEGLMKLWDMTPRNDLLSDRGTDEAYLAAAPGQKYALYFTDGGSVGLDLSGHTGTFTLKWIKIADGSWGGETTLSGGAVRTISAPSGGHWVAAILSPEAPQITEQPQDVSATENETVSFTVVATGLPAPTYQWKRNGTNITGATSATYSFRCSAGDEGAKFSVTVTNSEGSVTSREALLTVAGDTTGPKLMSVTATSTTEVHAVFDEALDASTADVAANYAITGGTGPSVSAAQLQPDGKTVKLTVSPELAEGVGYTLSVTGVKDEAGNDIQAGFSQKTFGYAAGLVGWWKFDDGSGTSAADSSPLGNHGTVNGATWTTGKIGGALSFGGTDSDYVEIPNESDYDLAEAVGYSVWIKANPSSTISWMGVVTKGDNMNLQRKGVEDCLVWQTRAGTITDYHLEGKTSVLDGEWHHVAVTYDGSQKCIYADGALDDSVAATGAIDTTDTPVMIGKNGQAPGHPFDGLIDDVRIYGRALTAAEVKALYDTGSGQPPSQDQDGDGLPDAWETQYGLDPTKPDTDGDGVQDPSEDPDGDGYTNLQEYHNNTNPNVSDEPGDGGCTGSGPGATDSAVGLLLAAICALTFRAPRSGSRVP